MITVYANTVLFEGQNLYGAMQPSEVGWVVCGGNIGVAAARRAALSRPR